MGSTSYNIIILGLAWLVYFVIHSCLASISFKNYVGTRWPGLTPAYRLIYNIIALILLIPPLWLIHSLDTPMLWKWHGLMFWSANGLAILAMIGFYWSLQYYDIKAFLGLRQWHEAERSIEESEGFKVSPLHRFIRHPWYFFGIVIIWTRDMDLAFFITAIALSLYLIIGSRLEEDKLLTYYGETYRHYMEQVPPLFPLPWRYLTKDEALRLMESYSKHPCL